MPFKLWGLGQRPIKNSPAVKKIDLLGNTVVPFSKLF